MVEERLVWLPVAHCKLNAIEPIWAYVKGKIDKVNMQKASENGRSMDAMKSLCVEAMGEVSPECWRKCVKHMKKIEDYYWEKDDLIDINPQIEQVVINLQESSDSSEIYCSENADLSSSTRRERTYPEVAPKVKVKSAGWLP
ncbi:hypothetical protein J437_LFUL009722 [Ladona fulva]|uniref:Tc1-like transposase DDE domain-containing protein n=1 Tax=Ladona fulva TaxID=123851 RepID=A0A8K0K761_LADFU|nr:hypothetical protein J437_LFUL009722 [Ladona fulva]